MSSLITRMRKQVAVYWARGSLNSYGDFTYAAPVEIACRWEDSWAMAVSRRDTRSAVTDSPKLTDESVVYVDREMNPGDVLWLGALSTLPTPLPADPRGVPGASEVKRMAYTPNIRNTEVLRKAYL